MSHDRLASALRFTLQFEGGLSEHPADRGGRTYKGITQRTYDGWRAQQGTPQRDVAQLTEDELQALYHTLYWRPTRCGELPAPVDLVLFDTAVNSGPAKAVRLLQETVGAAVDGRCGSRTVAATQAFAERSGGHALASAYLDRREAFLKELAASRPSQRVFLKGWLNRVAALRSFAGLEGALSFGLSDPRTASEAWRGGEDAPAPTPRTYEGELDLGPYLQEEAAERGDGILGPLLDALRGAIGDLSTLRVQTYTTREGDVEDRRRLRAQSQMGLDGNLEVDIPLNDDGTINADLWQIHQDMMRLGQAHQVTAAEELAETVSSFYALLIK